MLYQAEPRPDSERFRQIDDRFGRAVIPGGGVHSAILHYTGEDGFEAGIAASEHDVVENAIPRVVVGGVRAWAFFRP